jgi:lipopolysaccharide/colanic/teichoic acid biosynthesis glycosyltransferase
MIRLGGSLPGVLFAGYTPLAHRVAQALPQPVLGAVGGAALPEGVARLGSPAEFDAVVRHHRPGLIVVAGGPDWPVEKAAAAVLPYRDGIAVDHVAGLYEEMFRRVSFDDLRPHELLLSPALRADSRAMALQAVYTNLLGVTFLLAVSWLLTLAAAAVLLFGGKGPIFEGQQCAGFQGIPFRRLRFRTRLANGERSAAGRLLRALRIHHLPQLLNVVRGEMALFGPAPARLEFCDRLGKLIPFYPVRLSMKPGMLGWAQLHANGVQDECERLEYDLFYIKHAAPLFDLEILLLTLVARFNPKVRG